MPLSTQLQLKVNCESKINLAISCKGNARGPRLARGTKQSDQTSLQGDNQHTQTEQKK